MLKELKDSLVLMSKLVIQESTIDKQSAKNQILTIFIKNNLEGLVNSLELSDISNLSFQKAMKNQNANL